MCAFLWLFLTVCYEIDEQQQRRAKKLHFTFSFFLLVSFVKWDLQALNKQCNKRIKVKKRHIVIAITAPYIHSKTTAIIIFFSQIFSSELFSSIQKGENIFFSFDLQLFFVTNLNQIYVCNGCHSSQPPRQCHTAHTKFEIYIKLSIEFWKK